MGMSALPPSGYMGMSRWTWAEDRLPRLVPSKQTGAHTQGQIIKDLKWKPWIIPKDQSLPPTARALNDSGIASKCMLNVVWRLTFFRWSRKVPKRGFTLLLLFIWDLLLGLSLWKAIHQTPTPVPFWCPCAGTQSSDHFGYHPMWPV